MVQGVILDVDGTLVLSNDVHAQAWIEAFAAYGHKIQFSQVRPLIGMGGDQIVPQMVPGLSGEEGEGKAIADERKRIMLNDYGPTLVPAPGARDLVLRMKQQGLQLIIATSATQEELSVLLNAAQVDDLLTEATTIEDAAASKPSPDIVEAALEKIQLPPAQVIMLGDTPYDIEAAGTAGVKVIAFRCGGFSDRKLEDALAIYDHPADLLEQYDRSPLATAQTPLNA